MAKSTPTILVIVGITGDLSKRKLLPAIGQLAAAGVLPEQFKVVGITRRDNVELGSLISGVTNEQFLSEHTELFQMKLDEAGEYGRLAKYLGKLEDQFGEPAQKLFYLSVPPQMSQPIISFLGESGLAGQKGTKLLLEKPFGVDLDSAVEMVAHIDQYFKPEQVYRIDHYLAKEMAMNLIVFREDNSLFKRTWNKDFIDHIEIVASEDIGIEGRAAFYEQTGALRDVVQSHLMQLAALTLMDAPRADQLEDVPARRLAALQQLHVPADEPVTKVARRGQYAGYQDEVGEPHSAVETFVSLTLASDDPRWAGVPITLTTGKSLKEKVTAIKITYKQDEAHESNELTLRLQPDEGVEVCIWTKVPGYEHQVRRHALTFAYDDHYDELPEAYERVFLDAINSEHGLFASSAEVLETWRILHPVQAAWAMSEADLTEYQPGSAAADLTGRE